MSTYELSGGIPDEQIYQKFYGQTFLNEGTSEDILDADRRRTLKDLSCDEPWLESDIARNGGYDPKTGEARQGGSMSRGQLSLRFNGKRHEADPYIPDQFLDQEFLVADPRVNGNEPDFNEYNRQRRARGKFINFYNDDDLSVPESGINPTQMVKNVRQAVFTGGRDRLKIFSTSRDNMVTGYNMAPVSTSSRLPHVTTDGTIVNLNVADAPYRSNRTTVLSNMHLGWGSTPDQEFTIAKYGDMRSAMPIGMVNVGANRRNAEMDADEQVEFQGQRTSRALALTMANYLASKATNMMTADGIRWEDSVEMENRDANALPHVGGAAEILHMLDSSTMDGTGNPSMEQGARRQPLPAPDIYNFNAEVHHKVAEFMDLATRRSRQPDVTDTDIRYKIEDAVQRSESMEAKPTSQKYESNPVGMKFEADHGHVAEDSKQTFSYARSPTVVDNPTLFKMQEMHSHDTTRESRNVRHSHKTSGRSMGTEHMATDSDFYESSTEGTAKREHSSMYDKGRSRRSMEKTHVNDDYNDVNDT